LSPVKTDSGAPRVSLILENTAYMPAQLLYFEETQIALAGRSNVGKSSLINALAGRKKLAKVSSTPGKTRSVNFFRVVPWNFYLVDLPGYGYSRASHQERIRWTELLERYLSKSKNLRAIILLLDCRLPPQKSDIDLTNFANALRLSLVPVLTKSDKCNRLERETRQKEWQEILRQFPLVTASTKYFGIVELWNRLIALGTENI
jgi:GTP-binding protein